ncbi:MAG: TolC family protein, partial [Candidatus Tectomicrobia bacterium]|nr:TolC family protein [Candidatus Tectomicrobia bacterium]
MPPHAAEAEGPLTLQGAVERALRNNPALWAKRQELGVAVGELVTANLPLQANPQLELGAIRRSSDEGRRRVDPSISLSQEVEVAGQPGYRRKAARAGLEQAQLEIRDLERRIAGEVKVVFHQALAAQEKLKVAGQVVRLRKELLEAAQTRFEAGETAILPVKAIEVELGQAAREELELRKGLSAAQRELMRLLAWPEGEPLELGGELRYRPLGVPGGAEASSSPQAPRQPPSSPISPEPSSEPALDPIQGQSLDSLRE